MREHSARFEGPPPEAYSRVTNPGRFLPLHGIALERLQQLQSTFDAQRADLDTPDPDIKVALARPSVRLAPRDAAAAPIVVAFTSFPGLYLRCGRWFLEPFPSCGCDACDETLEEESERFLAMLDDVVAGRFRESIEMATRGDARFEWSLGAGTGWTRIDRQRAHELVGTGPSSFPWGAWPHT